MVLSGLLVELVIGGLAGQP